LDVFLAITRLVLGNTNAHRTVLLMPVELNLLRLLVLTDSLPLLSVLLSLVLPPVFGATFVQELFALHVAMLALLAKSDLGELVKPLALTLQPPPGLVVGLVKIVLMLPLAPVPL